MEFRKLEEKQHELEKNIGICTDADSCGTGSMYGKNPERVYTCRL